MMREHGAGIGSRAARGALRGRWIAAACALSCASPAAAAKLRVEVVDTRGKPVENAVVYARAVPGESWPAPKDPYVMDQVDKEFVPHILPIQAGARVRFPNKDEIHHHLYSFSDAKRFEVPLYKGKPSNAVLFEKAGVVRVGCNIHDWMSGVIVVLPTPVFAKTGKDGTAELDLGEAPSLEIEVFHERLRGDPSATRRTARPGGAGPETWKLPLKTEFRKKRPQVTY